MTDVDRERIEQAIAEAQLSPYQAMVIRTIAGEENVTAALGFIVSMMEATNER